MTLIWKFRAGANSPGSQVKFLKPARTSGEVWIQLPSGCATRVRRIELRRRLRGDQAVLFRSALEE